MKFHHFACLSFLSVFQMGSLLAATVKGKINPAPSYQTVYLYLTQGDFLQLVDSAKVRKGEFRFKSKENAFPRGVYRIGITEAESGQLILGADDIQVETNGRNWNEMRIKGSAENERFVLYRDLDSRFTFTMNVLEEKYKMLIPTAQTDRAGFDKAVNGLRSKADSLVRNQQEQYKAWLQGEGLFFSKLARLSYSQPEASVENFITDIDFEDQENLRMNIWINRVSFLFQRFGESDPEKWVILGDQVIKKTRPGTLAREIALRAVAKALQPLEQNGMSAAFDVAKQYTQEFPGKRSSDFIKNFAQGPPAVGEMAPDIVLPNRDGKETRLSELKGQVVLLDFWASWCGPCRRENPNVVRAYSKFQSKGFTVFSVSLDDNRDKWLAAITKDQLSWNHHVSDLKGWRSEGAALYKVTGIPATFLLDKNGKIIAKNLRGEALEAKLQELLGP